MIPPWTSVGTILVISLMDMRTGSSDKGLIEDDGTILISVVIVRL